MPDRNLLLDAMMAGADVVFDPHGAETSPFTTEVGGVSGNPRKFRHSALWNFLGGWSAA